MAKKEMRSLRFAGSEDLYEVVDAQARADIHTLQQNLSSTIQGGQEAIEKANQAVSKVADGLKSFADHLASPFNISGDVVVCHPVEDYPLNAKSIVKPVQAGSGDPYPGGGGKNLLENTATTQTINGVTFTVNADGSITANGTATENLNIVVMHKPDLIPGEKYILTGCPVGGDGTYTVQYTNYSDKAYVDKGNGVEIEGFDLNNYPNTRVRIDVSNGTVLSNITFYPMIRLASITDATYAPYSNIRPITGHTGAKLTRCGKNLLNRSDLANSLQVTQPGTTDAIMDGYGWRKDVAVGSTAEIGRTISLSCLRPGVTYTLSFVAWCSGSGVFYVDCYPDSLPETKINITATPTRYTWTFTSDNPEMSGAVIRAWGKNDGNDTWTVRVVDIHLEIGSTAESFVPYQGETFSTDFGQTVYGGTLDWNTGVLTVDRAGVTFDGSENWRSSGLYQQSGAYRYLFDIANMKLPENNNTEAEIISSHYSVISAQDGFVQKSLTGVSVQSDVSGVQIRDEKFKTAGVDAWKAYLSAQKTAGTPVQICYKLATPTTIQLTPQLFLALKGVNTLYSASGNTAVSGRIDPVWMNNTLLERIAALEAAIVSNA